MDEKEIFVAGIGVSRAIFADIATEAAEALDGVARVGSGDITSSLINVFTRTSEQGECPVEVEATGDDSVELTVHLSVFFGYPFTALAAQVREAVAAAVRDQVGCDVSAVNVCIDELVFPKE